MIIKLQNCIKIKNLLNLVNLPFKLILSWTWCPLQSTHFCTFTMDIKLANLENDQLLWFESELIPKNQTMVLFFTTPTQSLLTAHTPHTRLRSMQLLGKQCLQLSSFSEDVMSQVSGIVRSRQHRLGPNKPTVELLFCKGALLEANIHPFNIWKILETEQVCR